MKVWGHIADILEGGDACALVTVAGAAGSTPREAGARMVVLGDGGFHGTIGGGTLEFQAIRWAREALEREMPGLTMRRFSLGPDLGQCCGGRTDLAVEVLCAGQAANARMLAEREMEGTLFSTECRVVSGQPLLRSVRDMVSTLPFDRQEGDVLIESFGSDLRTLYLFGAGHVGRALILAMAHLPFRVVWADSRQSAFPGVAPANVTMVAPEDPKRLLADAPEDSFALIMTHSHALDEDIATAALTSPSCVYVGVIGSETKRARFEKRLRARGVPPGVISGMRCPIGNKGITSKTPAAIAAGVVVDLLIADETLRADVPAGVAQNLASGQ
jgi:xanthine dehydrogenase accessory factor